MSLFCKDIIMLIEKQLWLSLQYRFIKQYNKTVTIDNNSLMYLTFGFNFRYLSETFGYETIYKLGKPSAATVKLPKNY